MSYFALLCKCKDVRKGISLYLAEKSSRYFNIFASKKTFSKHVFICFIS